MTHQIYTRDTVAQAYDRTRALGATHEEAIASTAQALALPPEAVQSVVADRRSTQAQAA